jgi:hypothetical protein
MHVKESEWIGQRLNEIADGTLFPLMDVGSSTEDFRKRVQPHLEQNIYAPLRVRGGKVWHVDIKDAPGVDLVGDLCDPAFQARLAGVGVRSAMITNILHHVVDRAALCRGICACVPSSGHIIVSGPHAYPMHFDPIDTMFRPGVEELAACFPGTRLIAGAIIDSGNWREWRTQERGGRSLSRALARLLTPFYRPAKWWELARQSPYIIKHIKAVAVVLRKD